MSKPTALHTEGTAQVSEWLNISDTAKKLYQGKSNSGIKVIVESLWRWQPNCKQGLKAKVHFYQKSKSRRGKGKNAHTGSKIGFPWFRKSETIETNWSIDGLRLKSDTLRRGCRLQDRGAVQGRSESRQCVVAHRRGGRETRLACVCVCVNSKKTKSW